MRQRIGLFTSAKRRLKKIAHFYSYRTTFARFHTWFFFHLDTIWFRLSGHYPIQEFKEIYGFPILTELVIRSFLGHKEAVELLLDNGVKPDPSDSIGPSALSWAACLGYESVVKVLLDKGANVNHQDANHQTPLLCASFYGENGVVKLLLESGATQDCKNYRGQTPIILAADKGHEATVEVLLDNGVALDSRGPSGQTPLHFAANQGMDATVRLLLKRGFAADIEDIEGSTPLNMAVEYRHQTTVKLLAHDLLLKKGVVMDFGDEELDMNSLVIASIHSRGHTAVMRLLYPGFDTLIESESPTPFIARQEAS
ncbi:hypothetical protein MMC12_005898 [Toensbergia leucococca]|nr:hypothetical protein [Toensbergia leucococca]